MSLTNIRSFFASPRGWLLLLVCFHLVMNIWWLSADNHAIRTDEETHMLMARQYYEALFPRVGDRGFGARLAALVRIKADVGNPVHPPLLHITGAVLTRIIGYSVDRMAFVNTLAFLAAIIGVYLIARRFLTGGESFFAALVFSMTPMIYASSRYFMTDFLSMALVVWALYALLQSEGFMHVRSAAAFGLLTGLGLLTRTTVVLYLLVPCIVAVAIAFRFLFEQRGDKRGFNFGGLWNLVMHLLLSAFIALTVCCPWYILHGDQFYRHWMKPHKGGAGAPIAVLAYDKAESQEGSAPDAKTTAKLGEVREESDETPPAASAEQQQGVWRFIPERKVAWIRYPVFIINNAVFLPMFLMSLLGILVAATASRFRKYFAAWSLVCWLAGSYVLLTLVLSFAAPRYAMQALPALALLSVLPVFVLPKGRLRLGVQILYLAILFFQYGNLTVHAYGPIKEVGLPLILDDKYQKAYDDPELYVYKPVLHASSAYGRMGAPRQENYKDRLFFAMLKNEQEHPYYGIEAAYARLNIRGMVLDEKHFWPDGAAENPFRRQDIPPALAPYRHFKSYGWGDELEDILPALYLVDYVAYTTEGLSPEKEQEWLETMGSRGFNLIERFHEERFGMVPARWFGLLARDPAEPLPTARTADEIEALDMDELYKLRHSAVYGQLDATAREAVESQMDARRAAWGPSVPMNHHADYCHARIDRKPGDFFLYSFFLHSHAPALERYDVFLQGYVAPEDVKMYLGDDSGKPFEFQMRMRPVLPPELWPEKGLVLVRALGGMHPIPCQIRVALCAREGGIRGNIIDLGLVDFGAIPVDEE